MTSTTDRTGRRTRSRPSWDLVIVGGGISGAAALWFATAAGMRTLLVERDHIAAGPTGSSTANVRRHYSTGALAEIASESFRTYANFDRLTGRAPVLFRVGVALVVSAGELAVFEASVSRLQSLGARVSLLGPAEVAALVPGLELDGIAAAVYEPEGGYADAAAAANGFVEAAVSAGATSWTRTRVTRLRIEAGTATGVDLDDGRRISARRVLLAAGPWTNELLGPIGRAVSTFAERNAIAVIQLPDSARHALPCVFSDRPRRYYARPDGDSVIFVGGRTSGTAPTDRIDDFDASVPLAESAELVARVSDRLPRLRSAGIRPGFAGLYDVSPDGFPIVGPVPGIEGLFVWCGTSGHGFRLAPGLAAQLVERLRGRPTPLLDYFRLDRSYGPTGELTPR
jgi:sarcosine oxidase subunit beta